MLPALALLLGFGTIAITTLVHFEGILLISRMVRRFGQHPRRARMVSAVLCLSALHTAEILLFSLALFGAHHVGLGRLAGAQGHFADAFYLSAATYTTVGYGDLAPIGPMRLLAALEATAGPIMLGWSITFLLRVRLGPDGRDRDGPKPASSVNEAR